MIRVNDCFKRGLKELSAMTFLWLLLVHALADEHLVVPPKDSLDLEASKPSLECQEVY